MKSIIYILIAVILGGILMSAVPHPPVQEGHVIEIQCKTSNFSSDQFAQSVAIISGRLEVFGIQKSSIKTDSESGRIKIKSNSKLSSAELRSLLTTKGTLGFYETQSRATVLSALSKDDFIYSLMNIPSKKKAQETFASDALLGFSRGDNRADIENYLNKLASDGKTFPGVTFAWSHMPRENSDYELYLLSKEAVLSNSVVADASGKPNNYGASDILISFTSAGSTEWARMTRNSINKAIAIVIDGEVFASPVVRSEISGGKAMISGSFTDSEAKILASLISNAPLPLDFEIVE